MKILISINAFAVGGAQTFVIRLANNLAKDHSVHVYEHEPWRSSTLVELLDDRVTFHRFTPSKIPQYIQVKADSIIKRLRIPFSIRDRLLKRHFIKTMEKIKPDIINSHVIGSDIKVVNAGSDYPIVVSMHGCYEDQLKRTPGFPLIANRILSKVKAVIYAADKNLTILNHLNEKTQPNLYKVYYGFNKSLNSKPSRILDLEDDVFVYGMVARAIESKGWKQAIEAFIVLQHENPSTRMALVLVMEENEFFKVLKSQYGNIKNVIFFGYTNRPEEVIRRFQVGLLPTFFPGESLPNTVIEYLAAGKPVISTNIGEVENMIEAKKDYAGFIINSEDPNKGEFIVNLKDAMSNYLDDPELIRLHSNTAELAFKKFDMKTCIDRYLEVFQECKK